MKVVFLDRDGTIINDYLDDEWRAVSEPVFLEGAFQGLVGLQELGYKFIIVTNQYLIGEGYITIKQYEEFTDKLIACLEEEGIEILDVFYCPHSRQSECDCHKPARGMIDNALERFQDIDIRESILIGDSKYDRELAAAVGLRFYGIVSGERRDGFEFSSVLEVAGEIRGCVE